MKATLRFEQDVLNPGYWVLCVDHTVLTQLVALTLEEACELRDLLKKRLPVDPTWGDRDD